MFDMWPFRRHGDITRAHVEHAAAERHAEHSQEQLRAAKQLVAQARSVSHELERELEKNHFTEMFLEAMQRRKA